MPVQFVTTHITYCNPEIKVRLRLIDYGACHVAPLAFFVAIYLVELLHGGNTNASQKLEDLELILRSQAGDTEAFGQLVTKYRAKILTVHLRHRL